MKSFPSAFAAEKNKPVGAKPIWIMKLTINSVIYWLSGKEFTIPAFSGSSPWPVSTIVTTLPIVKSWGSIHQGITNWLSEFQVSEFSVTLILNTHYINLENLILTYPIENSAVELYEWFIGCSDPPQRLFHGYVRDLTSFTDVIMELSIQDDTIKLEKSYVGTKVTNSSFPSASSSDVGKVIPIPFGTVSKVPTVVLAGGIQLALKTSCTISDTTLYITNVSNVTSGMVFCIDSEQIYVNSVGTDYISVTRSYNSTTATIHAKGTSLVQLNTQVYCFSSRAITSISKVWLKQSDDVFMDISSYCSTYTGQSGNQLSGYGSYGCVQLTSANILSILSVLNLTQTDTIGIYDANHQHSISGQNISQYASGVGLTASGSSGVPVIVTNSLTFPSLPSGTFIQQTIHFEIQFQGAKQIYFDGVLAYNDISWTGSMSYDRTSTGSGNSTNVTVYGENNTYTSVKTNVCSRVVVIDTSTSINPASVSKTGTAQMTGSNMSTYFGSGKIFVDVVSNYNTAETICNYILSDNGMSSIQTVGTLPSYSFNGCITEYQTALWWLNYLALQAQAWFAIVNGTAKLINRPRTVVDKIISACKIGTDGVRALSRKKTDITEVINKINLLYNRDWSLSKGDSSYKSNSLTNDSASQTTYGIKEQSSLFQFDFITVTADATNLNSFYLTNYKDRHWIAEFDVFLDHSELEFGDYVQLTFLNNVCGTVIAASHTPGSFNQIDIVHLTVLIL